MFANGTFRPAHTSESILRAAQCESGYVVTRYRRFLITKRFGSLDGLRAISIVAVIWHHTQPSTTPEAFRWIGTHGVTLFFAISGFLITTLLLRERASAGAIDLKAFYWRRALRIFPLYYGVLLVYVLAVTAVEIDSAVRDAFFRNLPYFATYTSNIFVPLDGRVIFYFSWSLSAEEQFYLVWPPLLVLVRNQKAAATLLLTVLGCMAVADVAFGRTSTVFPAAIAAGALLAIGLNAERSFEVLWRIFGQPWSVLLSVFLVAFVVLTPGIPAFFVQLTFVAAVACCVIREDHVVAATLCVRPAVFLGTISYGMYMLHMLCKNAITKLAPSSWHIEAGPSMFICTFVLATAIAALSFRFYESRFLRLKHRHSIGAAVAVAASSGAVSPRR